MARTVVAAIEGLPVIPPVFAAPLVTITAESPLVATSGEAVVLGAVEPTVVLTPRRPAVVATIFTPALVTVTAGSPLTAPVGETTPLPASATVAPPVVTLVTGVAVPSSAAIAEFLVLFAAPVVTTVRPTGPPVVTCAARTVLGHAFSYLHHRDAPPLWALSYHYGCRHAERARRGGCVAVPRRAL
ncbi:hypothetical protein [Saccharomonospora xinjiangensis]|uniref:hypothetical protein n=1 Tax=Saccharomonospora xinjiangensis TaxID=75294 RepID=UPI0002D98756|nr:hypothetical protein [Saccharomonospora xinjiangensis]